MMDPLWSETYWSTFKYFIILIVSTYYILCISWIIKCLIIIDTWCKHGEHIDQLIKKISTACYALSCVKYSLPIETQKIIYFAHIHTIMSYSVIFWGNCSYAKKVFIFQKKIIRIITNTRPRDSCRETFRNMQIMTLYSQYIY